MSRDYEPYATDPGVDAPVGATRASPARTGLIIGIVAFVLGLVAMGLLLSRWDRAREIVAGEPKTSLSAGGVAVPGGELPAPAATDPVSVSLLDARVAELEARIARIGERAQAASGNAARAEGLLVAFAARRALDRGMTLGYIEGLLRERFGRTQPRAVATVITASRQPVTLEELRIGLDDLAPDISAGGPNEGWWEGFKREMSDLVIVRKAGTPSPAPAERLRRARRMLEGGRVDAALAEVARMPGRERAENWMAAARRYNAARQALDVIETAALLEPRDAAPVVVPPVVPVDLDAEATEDSR